MSTQYAYGDKGVIRPPRLSPPDPAIDAAAALHGVLWAREGGQPRVTSRPPPGPGRPRRQRPHRADGQARRLYTPPGNHPEAVHVTLRAPHVEGRLAACRFRTSMAWIPQRSGTQMPRRVLEDLELPRRTTGTAPQSEADDHVHREDRRRPRRQAAMAAVQGARQSASRELPHDG